MIKIDSSGVRIDYLRPSVSYPFWAVKLSGLKLPIDGKLRYVFVNGRREKEFAVLVDGKD